MINDTQNAFTAERQSLQAKDGRRILIDIWSPSQPRALIHLFHGLGEHPARYERFANHCNELGFAVAAHNHRGHGENCPEDELGHYDDKDGWDKVISDAALVQDELIRQLPHIPVILLGHSMGSYIAQSFFDARTWIGVCSCIVCNLVQFAPATPNWTLACCIRIHAWRQAQQECIAEQNGLW